MTRRELAWILALAASTLGCPGERKGGPPDAEAPTDPYVRTRPLWDSPNNPFQEEEWRNMREWSFTRDDTGFPREQLDDRRERRLPPNLPGVP